jgi:N-acetylmuramoyl-L-alanine amidase
MPSILIELGFLTNSAEEDYLMTDDGQDQMAQAIARSFAQYKVRREGGSNAAQEPVVPPAATPEVRLPEPTVQEIPKVEAPKQETAPAAVKVAPAPTEVMTSAAVSDVYFTVQLSVSGIQKSASESPFDALRGVFYVKDGRLFRYLYGRFSSRDDAYKALQEARLKGFPDAFMVAYRGTARITLDEADQALKKP